MTKLNCILAGFILLLSLPTLAATPSSDAPCDKKPTKGLKCVFVADGPLVTINSRLPEMVKKAGIVGHSQVALTYDADPKKRKAQILKAISGSKADLLGLGYSKDLMGNTPGLYIDVMDAALAINPKMQFMILSPSSPNIPVRELSAVKRNSDRFHKAVFTIIIKELRDRYPSNRVICASYGRASIELKARFTEKKLPGVSSLVGPKGVFLDKAGQPGPILAELNAMFTGLLMYDMDWADVKPKFEHQADLVSALAKVLRYEVKHRQNDLEPFTGDGPNIYTKETWVPDWGYTVPVKPRKGYNCLFYGHDYFIPLVEAIGPIAKKAGVTGHNPMTFSKRPHWGAPFSGKEALHATIPMPRKKRVPWIEKLRAFLDSGKVDVLGLTYYEMDTGRIEHYKMWFDYAISKNPKTRFLIHMPSSFDPARRNLKILNKTNDATRARFYTKVVQPLRKAYPKNEIMFWYSGNLTSEVRRRYEAGKLSPVKKYIGPRGIFAVPGGYPGHLLCDLEGLILYSLIYKVDLPKTMTGQKGKLDLNVLADEMLKIESAKGM